MEKQNMVYTYNGLFTSKNLWRTNIVCNITDS
jgi:hypothetical protein